MRQYWATTNLTGAVNCSPWEFVKMQTFLFLVPTSIHQQHLIAGEDYSPAAIAVIGNLRIGLLGLTTHVETRVGQESDLTLAVASPSKVVENILPALAPACGCGVDPLPLRFWGWGSQKWKIRRAPRYWRGRFQHRPNRLKMYQQAGVNIGSSYPYEIERKRV